MNADAVLQVLASAIADDIPLIYSVATTYGGQDAKTCIALLGMPASASFRVARVFREAVHS